MPGKKGSAKKAAGRGKKSVEPKGPLTELPGLLENPEQLQARVLHLAHDGALFAAYLAATSRGAAATLKEPPEVLEELEQASEAAFTAAHDMNHVLFHRIERPLREVSADQMRSAVRAFRASAGALEAILKSLGASLEP